MLHTDLFRSRLFAVLLFTALFQPVWVQAADPHWLIVRSSHFSVLTDAGEAKGHDAAVHFEQMRDVFAQLLMKSRVNMPEPADIIVLKNDEEFSKVCPTGADPGIARGGFFISGDDRNYFVLDASKDESWRAVAYGFARVLLNYNYPPTQVWFDEGFAQYFASLRTDSTRSEIGGDPTGSSKSGPSKSFVELLETSEWRPLPELFATKAAALTDHTGQDPHTALFRAQSWIVMHYLMHQNKLPETGTYFGLVQNEKLPVGDAIQNAYGQTAAQFEQGVKDYFRSLAPLFHAQPPNQPAAGSSAGPSQPISTIAPDLVATSTHETLDATAQSLLAEMRLRLPDHHEKARQELEAINGQHLTENAIAHRALGWDHLGKQEFDKAAEEFSDAEELDPKDPWTHYYQALMKYRQSQTESRDVKGLPNMMQDLHLVLDWAPEFAEAYHMLAWAQRQGGGVHAAMDSMRAAIQLNPRNQSYLLEMARIYLAGKDWEAATAILERLSASPDAQLAGAAQANLQDIPYLKKYGVAPQQQAASAAKPSPTSSAAKPGTIPPGAKPAAQPSASDEDSEQAPAEPQIDKRPILFLKGKLISVDCTQSPAAILTISAGTKTLKLRTADYKSISLIGEDQFSCEWSGRAISANYKAGGTADGDLVSLEIRSQF